MDIRVLRYFLAAVQAESISGAAQRLHVTQPTLSRQFMDLEEEFGHKIFVRSNRKLRLTPKGELLYERARAIVALCDRTREEMRADEELTGEVRIAAGETPALRTLARAIRRLRDEAPKVRCHIVSGAEEEVRSAMHTGLTDFGVFVGTADLLDYASLKLRQRDVWGIITPRSGQLAGKSAVEAGDLAGIPLLVSRQSFERNEFDGWLNYMGDDLNVTGTFNLLYNACLLAEEGIGHVLALGGIVNLTEASGLVWLPLKPRLECEVTLAWDRDRTLSRPAARLLELLREEEARLSA